MRVVLIGTGKIGVPTLQALQKSAEHTLIGVVTQPDKPVGRNQRLEPTPIKAALVGSNISIQQPARIKDRQSIDQINALQPDVIVVIAYGQILPRDVLEIPKLACLNLHASLLPRWRGAAPIQAAIAAGDRETGITVMYMDEGLDTGDTLLQRQIDILPNDNGDSLHDRLAQIGPDVLFESLQMLSRGQAPRAPQVPALATYAPKLNRGHGRINWSEPAEVIERKIRAYNSWPGAFTMITEKSGHEQKLKIFSATIVDLSERPGKTFIVGEEIVITAGRRALTLGEVQLEGKRRMTAKEFIRGHHLRVQQ